MELVQQLTNEFHLRAGQVENVVKLIDDGNTIPFIARYRKERTGFLICGDCKNERKRFGLRLKNKGNSLPNWKNPSQRRKSFPKWRIFTAPTNRKGVHAPPWQKKKGWNLWLWKF